MKHLRKKFAHKKKNIQYVIIFGGVAVLVGGVLLVRGFSHVFSHTLTGEYANETAGRATTTAFHTISGELLGTAKLSFAGGTVGRNKNIELGVAKINGTVVLPGAEFSFSKTLGEVTKEGGYSEEKVFLNGEVVKGIGGGLCQVSTTLFQSVLNTGLPVIERHNHTYTVSHYDVGLDATYSNPGPDLKFVNDTGHPITIHGSTENNMVVFQILGVKDGRIASTSDAEITHIVDFPPTKYIPVAVLPTNEPVCKNAPQIGYTARVTYDVVYATGETKEQIFTSTYRPLQRVCSVLAVTN